VAERRRKSPSVQIKKKNLLFLKKKKQKDFYVLCQVSRMRHTAPRGETVPPLPGLEVHRLSNDTVDRERISIPTEDDLHQDILQHLVARPNEPLVAAVWNGYSAALHQHGQISYNAMCRLNNFIPSAGNVQIVEILLGPDYVDEHPEVRDNVAERRRRWDLEREGGKEA
jgi:hypothetical protein